MTSPCNDEVEAVKFKTVPYNVTLHIRFSSINGLSEIQSMFSLLSGGLARFWWACLHFGFLPVALQKRKNFLLCVSVERRVLPSMQYMERHGGKCGQESSVNWSGASFLIVDPEENCYCTIFSGVLMEHSGYFHGHHHCSWRLEAKKENKKHPPVLQSINIYWCW